MASFVIESASKWLGSLVLQEAKSLWEVGDNVAKLQRELEWMKRLLEDADKKQKKDPLVRKWVSEMRSLVLDAEDAVAMYILNISHERKDGIRNSLRWVACCLTEAKSLHKASSKIAEVTSRISELSLMHQTYGVQRLSDGESSRSTEKRLDDQRQTYSHDQSEFLVGLDEVIAELTEKLKEGKEKILVAHGMGGIGKTALSRKVYHACRSQGHFVGCAWAYVSQQCSVRDVCKGLLKGLLPNEQTLIDGLEVSHLPGKLFEILQRNNYLVVLDDVWTLHDWKLLEPAFPINDNSCGSRILVTTRNPHIFENYFHSGLVLYWQAKTLNEDNSWRLLENKGCFKRNDLDPSMKELAQKTLNHCKGHPLAIVVLGGVLASKTSLEKWEYVCGNLPLHLKGDEQSYTGVYEVLEMSYYDLDYNLKPCFLRMAHFPEGWRFKVEKLYHLWIADGIVTSTQDERSMEDVASDYLKLLIQKSIVQVHPCSYGEYFSCSLHDLMRDKCLDMIIIENFLQIENIDENHRAASNSQTNVARRLTILVGKEDGQKVLDSLEGKTPALRSLMFISTCTGGERKEVSGDWIKTICNNFKLLRVLDFEGGVVLKGAVPREIGNLIYLRYLSLRGSKITELPSSIRNLKSLLILDLRVYRIVIKLPNVLWEMCSLRCLYLPGRDLSQEGLPHSEGVETTDGSLLILDKLSHLEKIDEVDLDKVDLKGLLELSSMRYLTASCYSNIGTLIPFLRSPSIKKLKLKTDASLLAGDSNMLLSKSSSLYALHLSSKKQSPMIMHIRVDMFPCNLVEVGFWYCLFLEDPMPVLEKLPSLKHLRLVICYYGRELSCSDKGFPELLHLCLDGLFFLRHLNVEKGGFPKLERFTTMNCPLEKIPEVFSPDLDIRYLDHLKPVVDEFRRQRKAPLDVIKYGPGVLNLAHPGVLDLARPI